MTELIFLEKKITHIWMLKQVISTINPNPVNQIAFFIFIIIF